MRAVFLVWDVLESLTDPGDIGQRLRDAGLQPVILAPGRDVPPETAAAWADALVVADAARPDCWSEGDGLLARAASRCDAPLAESFFVCRDGADVAAATEAGCRAVLVLDGRTLDDAFGPREPRQKQVAVAPDLDTALRYVREEAAQELEVGPFPYAERLPVDGHAPPLVPAGRDLVAVFVLVMLAGLAIALGIAYLLQEAYQRASFPPVAYWITLQFIPQTWRGVLFLGLGAAFGLLVRPFLSRLTRRYRTKRA